MVPLGLPGWLCPGFALATYFWPLEALGRVVPDFWGCATRTPGAVARLSALDSLDFAGPVAPARGGCRGAEAHGVVEAGGPHQARRALSRGRWAGLFLGGSEPLFVAA